MPLRVGVGGVIPRVDVDATVRSVADLLDRPWHRHLYGDVDPTEREWVGFDGSTFRAEGEVVRHGG
jgi:hypothetical protein